MLQNDRLDIAGRAISVVVDHSGPGADRPQLWPSVGMYPCYDELLYDLMSLDEVRNSAYRRALERTAPGRIALDIGTGRDLNWAIEAVTSGAAEVVAVEGMPETYELAKERLAEIGWSGRIKLCRGLSTDLTLERRADLCVSEIIGDIGGAEGAAAVLADARRRLTTPDATFVPDSCVTYAGATCFADIFPDGAGFLDQSTDLLRQAFTVHNGPFDVLLGVANAGPGHLLTDFAPVESLSFNGELAVEGDTSVTLTVSRPGRVDGLLLWIELRCLPGAVPVNSLTMRTNWMPVYLPLFDPPREAVPGEELHIGFRYRLSGDGVHPDYFVTARLGGATAEFPVPHRPGTFGAHPVYRRLFPAT